MEAASIEMGPMPDGNATWLLLPELWDDDHPELEIYHEQAPQLWVLRGWRHPLEHDLPRRIAPQWALYHPNRTVQVIDGVATHQWPTQCPINGALPRLTSALPSIPLSATIRLGTVSTREQVESLWIVPPEQAEFFRQALCDAPEASLSEYQSATHVDEQGQSWIVIRSVKLNPSPFLLTNVERYHVWAASDIYLPMKQTFVPVLRLDAIRSNIGHVEKHVSILRADERGTVCHLQLADAAFERLTEMLTYHPPQSQTLDVKISLNPLSEIPSFTLRLEAEAATETVSRQTKTIPPTHSDRSWVERSIDHIRRKVKRLKQSPKRLPVRSPLSPSRKIDAEVEPKPTDDLWNRRRSSLEERILLELPNLVPEGRARLWSELADVYTALGNAPSASLCWLNAIWEMPHAEPEWLESWRHAEARTARLEPDAITPENVLDVKPNAQRARLAALLLLQSTTLEAGTTRALLKLVQLHETDLPIRLVWLAQRHVLADQLGLARCRDRLFARLADQGPGLDLDAPAFFRFQFGDQGDRYVKAREWLIRIREPMQRWLQRTLKVGRLQWAGIDAELRHTRCYADLMLAWGLSRLGDRGRARDLQSHALTTLDSTRRPIHEVTVHGMLVRRFDDRITQARDGRPSEKENRANQATPMLDELGRYAIDKLRSVSLILEPHGTVNEYEARDTYWFLGNDRLKQELLPLLHHREAAVPSTVLDELLDRLEASLSARSTPRIVFALLNTAPLDAGHLTRLLPQVANAIEWIPEHVRLIGAPLTTDTFKPRVATRMLRAACQEARRLRVVEPFEQLAKAIVRQCDNPDSLLYQAATASLIELFQTLRRLELIPLTQQLMEHFVPLLSEQPTRQTLGCAIGWFTLGNEDAGYRLLNRTCESLYVHSTLTERTRTDLAIDYAATLGHAPLRIALGRLEEIFLRLDSITTRGATNRYYTLKPLQLIDTVISSVVGEASEVSQNVRDWLDDDEYLIRQRITHDLNQFINQPEA